MGEAAPGAALSRKCAVPRAARLMAGAPPYPPTWQGYMSESILQPPDHSVAALDDLSFPVPQFTRGEEFYPGPFQKGFTPAAYDALGWGERQEDEVEDELWEHWADESNLVETLQWFDQVCAHLLPAPSLTSLCSRRCTTTPPSPASGTRATTSVATRARSPSPTSGTPARSNTFTRGYTYPARAMRAGPDAHRAVRQACGPMMKRRITCMAQAQTDPYKSCIRWIDAEARCFQSIFCALPLSLSKALISLQARRSSSSLSSAPRAATPRWAIYVQSIRPPSIAA